MKKKMFSLVRAPIVILLVFTLLLGVVYPLGVTIFSQIIFHNKANGSLIEKGGKVVGSELLGQEFTEAKYFWSRLSATTPAYNAASSSGSNFSPRNPKTLEAMNDRVAELQKADPRNKNRIPVDLVTASGSGLDPHISVASAMYQVPRVARARHMKEEEVKEFIELLKTPHLFGIFGEPRVNVLKLNLALDESQKAETKEKR